MTVRFSRERPTPQIERSFTDEAVAFFKDTEPVEEQSEGVNAFSSIVAQVIAEDPSLVLIDEPEAFLHPMLAQRLGSLLATRAHNEQKSVFAATHSAAFLMGCVLSGAPVTVVRVTHSSEGSTCRVLPHDELQLVMRDPLLRSLGVLDALFHTSAVMCEADGDRAVYQEINSRLVVENTGLKEAVFINGGGKSMLYRTIDLLRRIGIPCAGIVDADVVKLEGADWTKLTQAIGIPATSAHGLGVAKGDLRAALRNRGLNPAQTGFTGLDPEDAAAAKHFCKQDKRGTGQIRGKVKEDMIGIGIADARSFRTEAVEGGGVSKQKARARILDLKVSAKQRATGARQKLRGNAKYRATQIGRRPQQRAILTDRSDSQIAKDPERVTTPQGF